MMIPTIGRTVFYTLSTQDAEQINRRRTSRQAIAAAARAGEWPIGAQAHIGNPVEAGEVYPMVIIRVWGQTPESAVNGKVLLDGTDDFWATSRVVGDQPGTWHWPPRI